MHVHLSWCICIREAARTHVAGGNSITGIAVPRVAFSKQHCCSCGYRNTKLNKQRNVVDGNLIAGETKTASSFNAQQGPSQFY